MLTFDRESNTFLCYKFKNATKNNETEAPPPNLRFPWDVNPIHYDNAWAHPRAIEPAWGTDKDRSRCHIQALQIN